ncbi:MAG: acylphosphatase [Phycisphaerae bacterium]|nr:acylphosphatase [Phycisphaerae bacterium]
MDQTARHVLFVGEVQGVGFRFTAQRIASLHGLAGFVRNLPDGTVEMFVQGPAEQIDLCLDEIDRALPGHVRERQVRHVRPRPDHTDFQIAF